MSNKFKPGETVKLKSGGPSMTVEGESQIGETICTWFDKDKKRQQESFPAEVLMQISLGTGRARAVSSWRS